MTTFAQRLRQACAEHPDIPEYGKGEQTHIAKAMKVSQEAVRKWFSGEAQPRQASMIRLARLLDVEYVWLALGTSETEFGRLRELSKNQDAVVHALISYMILKGYNVAFPMDDSDRSDLHAIGHGVQRNLIVRTPSDIKKREYTFRFPPADTQISMIAAIPKTTSCVAYDFVWIDPDDLRRCGQRDGAEWVIPIKWSDKKAAYTVCGKTTNTFLSRY